MNQSPTRAQAVTNPGFRGSGSGRGDEETLCVPWRGRGDGDEETLCAPGRGGKGWGDPPPPSLDGPSGIARIGVYKSREAPWRHS